jgi:hypothetical protein
MHIKSGDTLGASTQQGLPIWPLGPSQTRFWHANLTPPWSALRKFIPISRCYDPIIGPKTPRLWSRTSLGETATRVGLWRPLRRTAMSQVWCLFTGALPLGQVMPRGGTNKLAVGEDIITARDK